MTIDRRELASRIRSLDALTVDEKSALLELLNTRKRYGLVWEDKPEAVEEELREKLPVLKEVVARRILSEDSDVPNHILIDGDNLHAITALQYTHAGKVDVIYIDPPYNTGNKKFVYNDSCVDKDDAWRHSKWLSFMYKRLKLAKALLKDTGFLFISIDDNEQAQLRLICDEILGDERHVATFIWKSRKIIDSRNQTFASIDHEYIMCYGKSKNSQLRGKASDKNKYSNPDNDERGPWMSNSILGLADIENRPNLHYTITDTSTGITYPCQSASGWRYSQETMAAKIADRRIIFPKKPNGRPREKKYLSELQSEFTGFSSVLGDEVGCTLNGTRELRDILGDGCFDFPKPVSLIKAIVQQGAGDASLILDFFAGSGTTLHATMALNAEDEGRRQCILVTNNESNICENVTYERNKRVIQGYTKTNGEAIPGLKGNNLRYYKMDFVERAPSMKNRKALTRAAVDLLCVREDCYEPLKDYDGKDIRVFGQRQPKAQEDSTHKDGKLNLYPPQGAKGVDDKERHDLMIIFDPGKIDEAVALIERMPRKCKVYVFSPGHYAYDEEFESVADKIELCALPEAILQAYDKVLPKKRRASMPVMAEEVVE